MEIKLEKITTEDAEIILNIQKVTFKPLYDLYQDENSPYLQDITRIERRLNSTNGFYYKIIADSILVGAVYVFEKSANYFWLGNIFILPKFQNKGIAQQTITMVEELFPQAKEWGLDFPIDQMKNKICYEKAGYLDTGKRQVINDKLTLALYHKYVPKLNLVYPNIKHEIMWENILVEFENANEKIIPFALKLKCVNFCEYLKKTDSFYMNNISDELSHLVPAATYFLMNEDENKILGAVNIRYHLNEVLLKHGGHIGYGVAPSERKKGYATKMLSMSLDKCRLLGLSKVLVCCDKSNIGSSKTIINNDGVLENELTADDGNILQRYWIEL